ncbi:hypothetical protein PPYR_04021 [Photinus pyralis]|uniref:Uncharacterized protein n=2 Tax=Photinus pyralis TaxID=7054 RepID=A0A5N4AWV2_PHOPY|nr:uncharacterized protein LOC116163737 [Photinus pyralis]KAB0801835.1 hypothetical protein PPYR_04021 [Photinus pyralis]
MKATSLCFVLLCCIVQVLSAEFPEELIDDIVRECLKEHNVDIKELSKYFDDKLRITSVDDVGNKLIKCSIEKRKYYAPDGGFDKDVVLKDIAKSLTAFVKTEGTDYEALAEKLYEKCEGIKGADQVEHIVNWNNCLVDELVKMNN